MDEKQKQLKKWIDESDNIVFFGGAGVSTESGIPDFRSENGIYYVTEGTNGYISAEVETALDLGTHTLFIAAVKDMDVLNSIPSTTYSYYQSHIKPKPQPRPETAKGETIWRCRICGYEYKGETLPADFICPICKHPASDFEKITG